MALFFLVSGARSTPVGVATRYDLLLRGGRPRLKRQRRHLTSKFEYQAIACILNDDPAAFVASYLHRDVGDCVAAYHAFGAGPGQLPPSGHPKIKADLTLIFRRPKMPTAASAARAARIKAAYGPDGASRPPRASYHWQSSRSDDLETARPGPRLRGQQFNHAQDLRRLRSHHQRLLRAFGDQATELSHINRIRKVDLA